MAISISQQVIEIAFELVDALQPFADNDDPSAHQELNFVNGVQRAMQQALGALASTNCWGPDNRLPSSAFWNVAGEMLSAGVLELHAREKPHGYAGDFEMLQMICSNVRHGHGLAWALDDFFQKQAAPCAVRNRAALVAEELANHVTKVVGQAPHRLTRIVSLGSGPAADLARFGRLHPPLAAAVEIVLLDLDPRALQFAATALAPWFPCEAVQTHRVNLKRLPRLAGVTSLLSAADFVCCPGFFDYLNRDEAATMLRTLWNPLASGGQLLVFNFSNNNPSRAYMEWIGNWYLTYRSADELSTVGTLAGLPEDQFSVDVEPSGVNLYLRATKDLD